MNKISFLLFFLIFGWGSAQELQPKVVVNTQRINQPNQQVFTTLQRSLEEFISKTQWTDRKFSHNEKINCTFIFTINSYGSGNFEADLQIQSFRPVFNTSYLTNLLNFREKSIRFSYQENENLFFNETIFTSELTSVLAFYSYLIIGLDADTFSENGGKLYFEKAYSVVNNAQKTDNDAWKSTGKNNRWKLVTDLLSNDYELFHQSLYQYHLLGLDVFSENENAKKIIQDAVLLLSKIKNKQVNSFLIKLFFDAKSDEISQIFSEGKQINTSELKSFLENIAPYELEKWQKIK